MKISKSLIWLSILVAILAAFYAAVGLFSSGGDGSFTFTTVHGQTVNMYGRGLYSYDSAFKAPIFRGTDAVTLFVCVPILLLAVLYYSRGSMRGGIFLTSILAYFLYNSASLALGAAYNYLLLVYIACFSLSFFAFVMAFSAIDLQILAANTSPKLPRLGIAIFMFLSGLSLSIWFLDIFAALSQGTVPPNLGPYTTEATYTLDLGIIFPSAFLAGILILRRAPLGTLLASVLMTLNISIGLVVASQSIMQVLDGTILSPGEYAAYVAPFVLLSLVAIGLVSSIFRNILEKE
jgi:hypothetical protein